MSSDSIGDPISTRLVLVCKQASEAKIRGFLRFHAQWWERTNEIKLVVVPDCWSQIAPQIGRSVREIVPKSAEFVTILVADDLNPSRITAEANNIWNIFSEPSYMGFEKKLKAILPGIGLDWLSYAERILSQWRHGCVDKTQILRWLDQFDKLDSNKWIGESLLKSFDFWNDESLFLSIQLSDEVLANFQHICFHRRQPGKSADALASLFAKRMNAFHAELNEVVDFYDVLTGTPGSGNILFLEDGLFSGTEATKLLKDLLGIPVAPGRQRKAPALSDKKLLQEREISMLFPVATTFGLTRLKKFLVEMDLTKIQVHTTSLGRREVLSPLGEQALATGAIVDTEFDNCPSDPDAHFVPLAFSDNAIWKKGDQKHRAISFCKVIGGQLFQRYLDERNWEWPPEKVNRCSLGMYGMGLAFAFSHSIPRASLPIFWAGGKVKYQGKSIDWIPLFLNA